MTAIDRRAVRSLRSRRPPPMRLACQRCLRLNGHTVRFRRPLDLYRHLLECNPPSRHTPEGVTGGREGRGPSASAPGADTPGPRPPWDDPARPFA